MNRNSCVVALVCAVALVGCLVPEHFKADVTLQGNGDYEFHYKGTAMHAMAAAKQKQTGSLTTKDEADLRSEADKWAKLPEVKKITYKGQGRYELELDTAKKAREPLKILDMFTVSTDKSGVITIASTPIDKSGKEQLKSLGLIIDGELTVSLPKNAEVLSHNATSTPKLMGLLGTTYGWKIGSIDQRPEIKVRLKP